MVEDHLGDKQGELVTDHLVRRKLAWNKAFEGRAVVVLDKGQLPEYTLPGGLRLILLSPSRQKLNKLRERWEKTITKAELTLGAVHDKEKYFAKPADLLGEEFPDVEALAAKRFTGDKTVANGSSIAFLAEYKDEEGEKRCLFTGDAHVDVLNNSIKRLMAADDRRVKNGRLEIDALKISHHGSKNNISKELLDLIDCRKFLFSTNGQQFSHPDKEAVARVIKYGRAKGGNDPTLLFNYKSAFNKIWEQRGLQFKFDYETVYPLSETEGLVIRL